MLTCSCDKIYIGKTKRQLKIRVGEHMREIKEKNPEKPLAKHFCIFHKVNLGGMKIKGIYALKLSPRRGDFKTVLFRKKNGGFIR